MIILDLQFCHFWHLSMHLIFNIRIWQMYVCIRDGKNVFKSLTCRMIFSWVIDYRTSVHLNYLIPVLEAVIKINTKF